MPISATGDVATFRFCFAFSDLIRLVFWNFERNGDVTPVI